MRVGEREGMLMPRGDGDPECIVLKLSNGYNIGVEYKGQKIGLVKKGGKVATVTANKASHDSKKKTISILAVGGTIASKVDYRTGGVVAAYSADELIAAVPELAEIANIRGRLIMQVLSEEMRFEHYAKIASEVAKEIEAGADGVIILHGTDTMGYSSAALSFMLQNLPVGVLLVGAQRSSDRGSSDAAMNLVCAARFLVGSDFAGVGVCMHGSLEDDFCLVHSGTKVRKMHTSRRDAFRSVNVKPIAKIGYENGKIEMLGESYAKKNKEKTKTKLKLANKFEDKVALVKIFPGMHAKQLGYFAENGYKGLVIEGTGLGQMPVNDDKIASENSRIFEVVRRLVADGCVVVMASQCIYGRVNMNVYSTARELEKIGVIGAGDMHPELAYVKLKWLLGNYSGGEAKKKMNENLVGELEPRTEVEKDFE
ncbi:MAG: Glu-tRNA(Gln) amidotransferase subunit GatD [Candidatus Micrarchaeota archaeon]|nr:Glu-tRNA(Gln) amidotransferase subunit GatD [Candidatus Micrarchaeota archaeon]